MKKHISVMIVFGILSIISIFLIFQVNTNYDLTIYLPDDSKTSEGLNILKDEFGEHTVIEVMIDNMQVNDIMELKQQFYSINHVENVLWLDDYVDLTTVPLDYIPNEVLSNFYVEGYALITVVLDIDSFSTDIDGVVSDIKTVLDGNTFALRGDGIIEMENREIASHETIKILAIIVPIVILLLLLTSKSWFDPMIAIISLGVAVLLNLGTNAFLPNISFITKTMALALQLALSIDYTLFYLHRYHEERLTFDKHQSMRRAYKKTLPAITASALTTFSGFLALLFMKYKIGYDIGIVLSKGILLSYITTLVLVPIIILYFDKILINGRHKSIVKPPSHILKTVFKLRIPIIVLFIILIAGGIYFQSKTTYTYGTNQSLDDTSEVAIDNVEIAEVFGAYQQMIILIPNNQLSNEIALVQALSSNEHILAVDTLITHVSPTIDRSLLDPLPVKQYVGNQYTRIILKTDILEENDMMYEFSDNINNLVHQIYDEYYIVGLASTAAEIESIVTADHLKVMLISMIAIFVILAFTFRNPIIPVFLILLIESAIWINVSILYFANIHTIYIGYLVVMSIQLGATIDYSVLLTSRYLENRKRNNKFMALETSYQKSLITVIISAIILSVAGFSEGLFSNISTIQDIGFLLGKGTLISLIFTMFFLPVILLLLDKLIIKTTIRRALK